MTNKVPEHVAKDVKECVFLEADCCNYLARSRVENGGFLRQLVAMPEVGGRLAQYMRKDEVKTYIKDAILNRYSKDKTQEERPSNLEEVIQRIMQINALFVEHGGKGQISLFRAHAENIYVVVADGTILKWETALRKALLYVASKPFSEDPNHSIKIVLTLFARFQKISPSDLRHLKKALSVCNAMPYVYGEG